VCMFVKETICFTF